MTMVVETEENDENNLEKIRMNVSMSNLEHCSRMSCLSYESSFFKLKSGKHTFMYVAYVAYFTNAKNERFEIFSLRNFD